MTTFAEKALPLVARNCPVFPCGRDKRPLIKGGFRSATTDPNQIQAWNALHPAALVGMPTGGQTFVLDIDVGHDNGADGFATLQEKGWVLPATRIHRTSGGGAHAFLKVPEGMVIKSSAGKLGQGLDIRGAGGYVIRHDLEGLPVENPGVFADAPPWLIDALSTDHTPSSSGPPGPAMLTMPDAIASVDNDLGAPLGLSSHEIAATLAQLDPNMGYSDWVMVAQALHAETGGSALGLTAWTVWSSHSDKFPGAAALAAKWQTFGRHDGPAVTMRSILKMARDRKTIASDGQAGLSGVQLICATSIEAVPVQWLWHGWLARGKLTILAGDAGTGKTTLALALAATVTTGGNWPDGVRGREAGNILIWSGEDDYADTIKPRLQAAAADMTRVFFVQSVVDPMTHEALPFDPARDIPALKLAIQRAGGASLLIVDPIVSAVAGDMHRANDVRRALQGLVNLAESQRCAVLGITHFSKGSVGASPQSRVIGSQAFAALARTVLVAAKQDSTDARVLARAKNNLGIDDGGVAYTIEPALAGDLHTTKAVWGGCVEGSAREILGTVEQPKGDSELERAQIFLRELLADGPVDSRQIKADANGAGYSWATIRRAKDVMGIAMERSTEPGRGGSIYLWKLPAEFGTGVPKSVEKLVFGTEQKAEFDVLIPL